MAGFTVSCDYTAIPQGQRPSCRSDPGSRISIAAGPEVHRIATRSGSDVLIDGYALGVEPDQLANAIAAEDDALLSRLHGHFSALVIEENGELSGICDRFGARSLYWREDGSRYVVCSRWESMPLGGLSWEPTGMAESVHYRYLGGTSTVVRGVSRLPHGFRWRLSPGQRRPAVTSLPPRHQQPVFIRPLPFERVVEDTCSALSGAIAEASVHYDNVAIFLSGGVDSSLLAALSKLYFKRCLLVTPVFPGHDNPELDAAKAFAGILKLEHLLVPVDETRLEQDLRKLTWQKGSQPTFQLLAIQQMMAALPAEYRLIMTGEVADTLFGSRLFKRTEAHLRLKRQADRLPRLAADWLSSFPNGRVRRFAKLRNVSAVDIAIQHNRVPYSDDSLPMIRDLCSSASPEELFLHKRNRDRVPDPSDHLQVRRTFRENGLSATSANHFYECELAALNAGKHLFAPFMDHRVVQVANVLTREQFYGKDFLKPVLRELACEFYPRNLVYAKKWGFEVPYFAWLDGPLKTLVASARDERQLFDGRRLQALDVAAHYPAYWTLVTLKLLHRWLVESPAPEQETSADLHESPAVPLAPAAESVKVG